MTNFTFILWQFQYAFIAVPSNGVVTYQKNYFAEDNRFRQRGKIMDEWGKDEGSLRDSMQKRFIKMFKTKSIVQKLK